MVTRFIRIIIFHIIFPICLRNIWRKKHLLESLNAKASTKKFFRLAGTCGKQLREQTIVLVMNTILALMYLLRHIFSSYLAIVCDIDLGVKLPFPSLPPPSQPTATPQSIGKRFTSAQHGNFPCAFLHLSECVLGVSRRLSL